MFIAHLTLFMKQRLFQIKIVANNVLIFITPANCVFGLGVYNVFTLYICMSVCASVMFWFLSLGYLISTAY